MLIERLVIICTALYFVLLGSGALIQPATAKSFLLGFATSPNKHYLELVLRSIVGVAFVRHAPSMLHSTAFSVFGWVLLVTTAGLFLVPWRLHQRFAEYSVPKAAQHIKLIGIAALAIGIAILAALALAP